MKQRLLNFHHISFAYSSSSKNLITDFSADLTIGWTGIVGANGTGKSTFLKLASGELHPDSGKILFSGKAIYCRQRTDDIPDKFIEFLNAFSKSSCKIMGLLDIDPEWQYRWDTLSHGERKRAQIATALYQSPDILAVDEPTNHLDVDAKRWMMETLASFRGIGLLVSHDRNLLDQLCKKCIFFDPPDVKVFTGNYTKSFKQKQMMEMHLKKKYFQTKQQAKYLKKEENRRRQEASVSDKRVSKKRISSKDHDAKNKINLVKLSGKDGCAGKKLNQISGRVLQVQEKLERMHFKKQYKTGIKLVGETSKRDVLFKLKKNRIRLSAKKEICFNDLYIRSKDRIGITGRNGYGKTTLLEYIRSLIELEENKILYLPQEIDISSSIRKVEAIKKLPNEKLGKIMIIIARLGSRPDRVLETIKPSPGELRKILLAEGISKNPHLIIMDEPTNHLDLPSVECLEEALLLCSSSLLLVSHDLKFIDNMTNKRWDISIYKKRKDNICQTQLLKLSERIV